MKNNKLPKKKYKTGTILLVMIFLVLVVFIPMTVILNNSLPESFGFDIRNTPVFRLIFLCILIPPIGTAVSKAFSKKTINLIDEIDLATKEIANGNYNIRIEGQSRLIELDDMVQNFNLMARDLAMNDMMRNDFISNVSHEFKTPLSAIEGYATLLTSKDLPPEKVEQYAKSILLNSKRLSKMTGHILLLSSLDNSRIPLKKSSFSLDEQIREIILLFEKEWSEKEIELDINLEDANFFGDKDLLSHVWQNLFSNAVKFCENSGIIGVNLRNRDNGVEFSITNTGSEIKKDEISRIFEKFYQADNSRTAKGNGLGLSIVDKIVSLHGGTIKVDSDTGKTIKFTVFIPD